MSRHGFFSYNGRLCHEMNRHVATRFLGKGASLGHEREFSVATETNWPCVAIGFWAGTRATRSQ